MAPEQDDAIHGERFALEQDLAGIEGDRRIEPRDREVRRERTLLDLELAGQRLVERAGERRRPRGGIVEARPQDARGRAFGNPPRPATRVSNGAWPSATSPPST